jgi:hypothetical protein
MTRTQVEEEVIEVVEGHLDQIIDGLAAAVEEQQLFSSDTDEALVAELRRAAAAEIHAGVLAYTLERRLPETPPAETSRLARRAAVSGVPLASLLQVYLVGMRFYWESIYDAIQATAASAGVKEDVVRGGTRFLHEFIALVAAFAADEYGDERLRVLRRRTLRRLTAVREVLAGGRASESTLGHDLRLAHRGIVATGPGVEDELADLRRDARVSVLIVPDEDTVWAWASGEAQDLLRIEDAIGAAADDGAHVGLGRIQHGVDGFRVTHRQALTAHRFAQALGQPVIRHEEVAVAALASADRAAAAQLVHDELGALMGEQQRAGRLMDTLSAYLEHGQNGASAAAVLGVSPRTVSHRLRLIESALGHPVSSRAIELHTALRLVRFGVA